ncbi:WW domain-binding protein 4 [Biomphalaria pfeifferi]|uniref:WW domain-binding protein 4 n=1 Tax=Biomphalaria pfeifferi TaxID=112525 RepID=A0AAD8BX04_BIOPF|nr:WW domain-binding protein 4 [Biomphalaria pfeifferi]
MRRDMTFLCKMSEYWKSVPRKFCDFCKCWITDNKPSVDFHERGKRHQENVELRLKEVRKKSLQKSADDEQLKKDMDKMEKAALEAFKKDLKDNPELAAKYGVSLEPKPQPSNCTQKPSQDKAKETQKEKKEKVEKSVWEAPEDYLSLAEQEAQKTQNVSQDSDVVEKEETKDATVKETITPPVVVQEAKITFKCSTSNNRSAYGSWSVVKEVEQPTIYDDSSTPPSLDEIPLPEEPSADDSTPVPKRPKFKEKIVTSLCPESGETVTFKKRKIATGSRNVRQKTGDD